MNLNEVIPPVREDFLPVDAYISPEWAKLEKENLWPRIWQMACREEDIPQPGNFYTYEIGDESISVVRQKDGSVAAFYNVCAHRGRRLTAGCGQMSLFRCRFHGWKWNLDGTPAEVVDREDWGDLIQDKDITLLSVKVGIWSGWIFINMDPESESLDDFLAPVKPIIDPFDIGEMRYNWRRQTILPCNWKVALEAFDEGYHTQTTHAQLVPHYNDFTYSAAHGPHGMFGPPADGLAGAPSPRLGKPIGDMRKGLPAFQREIYDTLNALTTDEMMAAGERLMELPETATPFEIYMAFDQFHREESAKNGTPWPDITFEQVMRAGTDWHIFPNMVFLPTSTSILAYRARPNGDDPDSCIFEVYTLQRYAPGKAPKADLQAADDWREIDWLMILKQDFDNVGEVQKGLKSRGFRGSRPSPVQERAISNFHATLQEYVLGRPKPI